MTHDLVTTRIRAAIHRFADAMKLTPKQSKRLELSLKYVGMTRKHRTRLKIRGILGK